MISEYPIRVVYVNFNYTNRLTFIWNGLFLLAKNSGCQYYYQLNDDINLYTQDWAQKFIASLTIHDNIGVVGPSDPLWNCKVLTVAFVNIQSHWSIFGYFYPMADFKDWHSDSWLTHVYGEKMQCSDEIIAVNTKGQGGKSRYHQCEKNNWWNIVLRDRNKINTAIS
jgi:hypothetical protein